MTAKEIGTKLDIPINSTYQHELSKTISKKGPRSGHLGKPIPYKPELAKRIVTELNMDPSNIRRWKHR